MSRKKSKAARKTENTKSYNSTKNMQNAKSTQNVKNTPNTESTSNTKNTQKAKNTQGVTSKSAAKKKASRKIFWLTLAICISAALNIVLIVLLVVGNKGNSDIDTSGTDTFDTDITGNYATDTYTSDTYTSDTDTSGTDMFTFSEGISENGFWEGITAQDYVELFDYLSLSIPREIHEVSDADIQSEINNLAASYFPDSRQIMDRAVVDGDTVNIDYVGSVDGVEFDGGSTGGEGTNVTAGSTDYIDDFLSQIIGHMPGETVNVEVTFPDVYDNNPDLAGKDALFVTTINYIVEYLSEVDYDISDAFVEENLYADYGWMTVDEMEENVRDGLQHSAIENYVREYIANETTFYGAPDYITAYQERLIENQEKGMLDYYQDMADSYETDLDTILQYFAGVSGTDELIEQNRNGISGDIKRTFVVQAVAEDAGISVSVEDMEYYLPDYSSYEEQYGMPWLKQYVLGLKVIEYIIENAVFA